MFGVRIDRTTLATYYKANGVTFTKVKRSIQCSRNKEELRKMRVDFILKLLNQINSGARMLYMDETTTNLWDLRRRVWQQKDNKMCCAVNSN